MLYLLGKELNSVYLEKSCPKPVLSTVEDKEEGQKRGVGFSIMHNTIFKKGLKEENITKEDVSAAGNSAKRLLKDKFLGISYCSVG